MSFEDVAVKAIAELDRDIKELRETVAKLEGLVGEITTKVKALQPPKPVVTTGDWMKKWGR